MQNEIRTNEKERQEREMVELMNQAQMFGHEEELKRLKALWTFLNQRQEEE